MLLRMANFDATGQITSFKEIKPETLRDEYNHSLKPCYEKKFSFVWICLSNPVYLKHGRRMIRSPFRAKHHHILSSMISFKCHRFERTSFCSVYASTWLKRLESVASRTILLYRCLDPEVHAPIGYCIPQRYETTGGKALADGLNVYQDQRAVA